MNIDFREIDRSNYNECIALSLRDDQKDYVTTNGKIYREYRMLKESFN
ncbi:MAG: hypothetical protein RR838_03515 [Clostridium sp.]